MYTDFRDRIMKHMLTANDSNSWKEIRPAVSERPIPQFKMIGESKIIETTKILPKNVPNASDSEFEISKGYKGHWFFLDTSSDTLKVSSFKNGVHRHDIDVNTRNWVIRSRGFPVDSGVRNVK